MMSSRTCRKRSHLILITDSSRRIKESTIKTVLTLKLSKKKLRDMERLMMRVNGKKKNRRQQPSRKVVNYLKGNIDLSKPLWMLTEIMIFQKVVLQ